MLELMEILYSINVRIYFSLVSRLSAAFVVLHFLIHTFYSVQLRRSEPGGFRLGSSANKIWIH